MRGWWLALWLAGCIGLVGQPYSLEPVTAEWVPMEREYADARKAPLGNIMRLVAGADGDIYFTCLDLRRVFRLTAAGRVEVWAGSGRTPQKWSVEPKAAEDAEFEIPAGLAFDRDGTLYVSDPGRIYAIRKRKVELYAGNGRLRPMADDLPAREVSAHGAGQLALGPKGEVLFYDYRSGAIREVRKDGVMGTFIGKEPMVTLPVMHPRASMAVGYTITLSIDAKGVVWFAEGADIQRVDYATGQKLGNTPLKKGPNCRPDSLVHHKSGAMAIGCESEGELWLYASQDAEPRVIRRHVSALAFDDGGSLWFSQGNRIYRMRPGGEPEHMAGAGLYGDGGPATEAWFARGYGVAMDGEGNLIVGDRYHHVVRRIGRDGRIETIAGIGEGGNTGDGGPAKEARLFEPVGVAVGRDGSIYIQVMRPSAIRRVDRQGLIHTMNGVDSILRSITMPSAMILDREDRPIMGDQFDGQIGRLERDGRVVMLAGTGHLAMGGATGLATRTPIGRVSGLGMGEDGSLLFTQAVGSNLLRRVNSGGWLENLAGNDKGKVLEAEPRPGLEVRLQEPGGVVEMPGEGTLIANGYQVVLLRKDGMLHPYANSRNSTNGYSGMVVDGDKNTYVMDSGSGVLRIIRRKGGLPASPHRMASRPLSKGDEARWYAWRDLWPIGLLGVGAVIPLAARRWWYRRQKARLLRGVDSDLSAVFSPRAVSPRADVSGTLDGRYRILESLAQGGSAVVYKAEDKRNPGRLVAVKVFDLPEEDPVAVQRRLLRECVASSRVRHAAVAPMLDVGMTEGGQPYLVMEFVEGESLRAVLRRGVMERGMAVRLLGELAEAVAAAHGQGVLHLDIKPENLMIRAESGRLVLIDFGLAAVAEGGALATHMSSVGGTLDYMAPEQLLGHVSAGADIYACGAVALEMLSGKRVADLELPPNNQDLELTGERVRAVVPGLSEAAVGVLARMLSLRPEERPAALAELVTALG